MAPFIKYLPHLGVTGLIVFLAADYFYVGGKPPSPSSKINLSDKEEGSHSRESASITQEERERRMGIFHYNEGNKFYKEGNFNEAIIRYKKALLHNEEFKEAFINLSTTLMKKDRFQEAFETLETSQKKFPKDPLIDYNLACYYSLTKNLGPGLSSLQNAVKKGYKQFRRMENDPDLQNLRQSEIYRAWKRNNPTSMNSEAFP